MTPLILYQQQAAKERDAADTAVLKNVRDRSRRAAEAWTKLAGQVERTDEFRAARDAAADAGASVSDPSENPDRGRVSGSPEPDSSTTAAGARDGTDSDG